MTIPSDTSEKNIPKDFSVENIYGKLTDDEILQSRKSHIQSVRLAFKSLPKTRTRVPQHDASFVGMDPELVTFESASDPLYPKNWPLRRKLFTVVVASLYVGAEPFVSAAFPKSTTLSLAHSGSSVFVMLMVKIVPRLIGLVIVGPLSDYFGRKVLLNASVSILIGSSALVHVYFDRFSFFQLASFSFLSTLGASSPLSVGSKILNDVFSPSAVGGGLLVYLCGPVVSYFGSPVAVNLIKEFPAGYSSGCFCVVMALLFALIPETSPAMILHQKVTVLRQLTGNKHLHSLYEITREPISVQLRRHLGRTFAMAGSHPSLYIAMLIGALLFGVIAAIWALWWA